MSLLATRQDFEPATPEEQATALYWDPNVRVGYSLMEQTIQSRINALKGHFAPNNQKTAIWGSGWGWLVSMAVAAGYDAYGFDASQYAVDKSKTLYPTIASRFFLRNCTVSADVNASRSDAGLRGQNRFALLITEDLLECLTDQEIAITVPLLRNVCSANLGHIVTPIDPWSQEHGSADPRINWKTYDQWKILLSPPDIVLGALGETV